MLTPYQKRQKDEDFTFDNVKRRRNTKDEQRRSKEQKKKKVNFQNKCVSSQKHRMKKEEGATVDSSAIFYPTFLQRAVRLSFCGPDGQRSSMELSKSVGKPH